MKPTSSPDSRLQNHSFPGEFLVPLLLQFIVLLICFPMHQLSISRGALVYEPVMLGDEMTSPTMGRMIYALFACFAAFFCAFTASRLSLADEKANRDKPFIPFILGAFSGTFLWQAFGEDFWHFALNGVHFVRLESITVLPEFLLFSAVLIYILRHHSLDWGALCSLLSFTVNWFGHYVLLAPYSLFASLFPDPMMWYKIDGIVLGSVLCLLSLWLGVKKSRTCRQRMLASILCYFAIAVLIFGILGG